MKKKTAPIRLRPIKASDNETVASLIREVMAEFSCTGDGYSVNDKEVDAMYESYTSPSAAFYVLEQEGKILGCGGFGPLAGGKKKTCELKKMYFLPKLRGTGWGHRLLQHCMTEAKEAGYKRMYLETVKRMKAANGLYQSYDFQRLKKPLGDTGHNGCDRYYQKEL